MDNCNIIEDLLPSYCGGLTSKQTNQFIHDHVANCPHCTGLLERLPPQLEDEKLPDKREEFSKALQQYERAHRKKTQKIIICCATILLIIILIWANSYHIALALSGVDFKNMCVIDQYQLGNLKEPRTTCALIQTETKDGEYALVTVSRNNFLNFWYPEGCKTTNSIQQPIINETWFGEGTYIWHEDTQLNYIPEYNFLYCGNNALKPIIIPSEQLPGNVMVRIHQSGEHYWIHLITQDSDALAQFDILAHLKEQGFIDYPQLNQ